MRPKDRGFTLVETLVGLLILMFIVTTSLTIVFERERRLLYASETFAAYQALANEIEVRRHMPFEELLPGEANMFMSQSAILNNLPEVEQHVEIQETEPGLKTVTLGLRWRAGQRSVSLSMIRSSTGGENLW